jgi:hypothetical protein
MHQYIVVGEPQDCPKLFETQGRVSDGKEAETGRSAKFCLSYIKFQTGRSILNYKVY